MHAPQGTRKQAVVVATSTGTSWKTVRHVLCSQLSVSQLNKLPTAMLAFMPSRRVAKRGNISEVLQPRLPHNWKLVVVGLQSEPRHKSCVQGNMSWSWRSGRRNCESTGLPHCQEEMWRQTTQDLGFRTSWRTRPLDASEKNGRHLAHRKTSWLMRSGAKMCTVHIL